MESKKLTQFKEQWDNIDLIRIFEVEVVDKRAKETDWIIFDISIVGFSFIAQHVALTKKQDKSTKIAFVKLVIDPDFSLDENLQELSSLCDMAIINSEYFELPE